MIKDLLKDTKTMATVITSVGGVILAAYALYLMATVVSENTKATSANTQATQQMSQLLIEVLGNKNNRAALIMNIKNLANK